MINNGGWDPNHQTRMLTVHGGFSIILEKGVLIYSKAHPLCHYHAFKSAITYFNLGIKRPNNHFKSTIIGSQIHNEIKESFHPISQKEKSPFYFSNPSMILFKHTLTLVDSTRQRERLRKGGRFTPRVAKPESLGFAFHCFKVKNSFLNDGDWILAL